MPQCTTDSHRIVSKTTYDRLIAANDDKPVWVMTDLLFILSDENIDVIFMNGFFGNYHCLD